MKLKEVVLKVNSLTGWSISMGYYRGDGGIRFLNIGLEELYSGWKKDTLPWSYPENGDYIYAVILGYCSGNMYIIDCDDNNPLTFEELMQSIDDKLH